MRKRLIFSSHSKDLHHSLLQYTHEEVLHQSKFCNTGKNFFFGVLDEIGISLNCNTRITRTFLELNMRFICLPTWRTHSNLFISKLLEVITELIFSYFGERTLLPRRKALFHNMKITEWSLSFLLTTCLFSESI